MRTFPAGGVMNEGLFASWLGFSGIPREAEVLPLERDLRLAALTGANYHAAKISTAMSADAIRAAKDKGCRSPPAFRSTTCRSTRTTSANTAPSSSCRRRCATRTTGWRWSRR
jgi:hypothetical protein